MSSVRDKCAESFPVDNFVHEQNVLRFSERLETENDQTARVQLTKLLLDEENKFAASSERLDRADRHIAKCKQHIARQYSLIDKLKMDGHDIAPAERLLRNLMELHDLFVGYRRQVATALARTTL